MALLRGCEGMSIGAISKSAELASASLATTGESGVSASSHMVVQTTALLLLLSINSCIIISVSNGLAEEAAGEMSIGEGLTGVAVGLGTEGDVDVP